MSIYKKLKNFILFLTLFLFPLFFLPTTQEYFITNKLYLLILSSILLLLITTVEIVLTGKFKIQLGKLDLLKIFFVLSVLLSTIIISPNKVQALLNPNFGFFTLLSLIIFITYLSKSSLNILKILSFSTLLLSLITIIISFHLFENNYLPLQLQFLRNYYFTPLGSQTDLLIFLGFMLLAQTIQLLLNLKSKKTELHNNLLHLSGVVACSIALVITIITLYRGNPEPVMPFKYAWLSFAETLKNPFNAVFGIGIDNLPAAFTKAKDVSYNHSPLWQIRSFEVSASTLLHVATESGLLGLGFLIGIIYSALKSALKESKLMLTLFVSLLLIVLFSPPSLIVFFVFFLGLATLIEQKNVKKLIDLNLKNKPLNLTIAYVLIILLVFFSYVFYRSYSAEYFFKKSIISLDNNEGRTLYDNQRHAILANPFIERYHLNFSRTNLLLSNVIPTKVGIQEETENNMVPPKAEDNIASEAARVALLEAELVTRLNPQKATNWENLAVIARNLTDVIPDAENRSLIAYERAVLLDPQNPQYRFSLGTLHYIAGNFSEAVRSFEQAVALKIDWANAHYNLAWTLFQNREFAKAIKELEATIQLLDPAIDKVDLDKAKNDLEMMKSSSSGSVNILDSKLPGVQLDLPEPKTATPEIKLESNDADILPISTSESILQQR